MSAAYVWKPTQEVVDYSNIGRFMKRHGIAGYRELVARSTADDRVVLELWSSTTLASNSTGLLISCWIQSPASPGRAGFVGGQVNLAHNCLDRHARSGAATTGRHLGRRAGGEPPAHLRRAARETCRLSNALKRLGVGRGDAVGLFLP